MKKEKMKKKCDEKHFVMKTQLVTKLKKSTCDKTQKLKLRQISKTQIVTILKNSICDQTK